MKASHIYKIVLVVNIILLLFSLNYLMSVVYSYKYDIVKIAVFSKLSEDEKNMQIEDYIERYKKKKKIAMLSSVFFSITLIGVIVFKRSFKTTYEIKDVIDHDIHISDNPENSQ